MGMGMHGHDLTALRHRDSPPSSSIGQRAAAGRDHPVALGGRTNGGTPSSRGATIGSPRERVLRTCVDRGGQQSRPFAYLVLVLDRERRSPDGEPAEE